MHILRSHTRILLIPITLLAWNASGCSDAHDPGGTHGSETDAVDTMDDEDTMDPDDGGGSDGDATSSGGSDSDSDGDSGDSGEPQDTGEEPLVYGVRCSDIGMTEKAATQFDSEDTELAWAADYDAEANSLTLTRAGVCGEECEFVDELVFLNATGPTGSVCEEVELLHAARRITDAIEGDQDIEFDELGMPFIQDWDFDALISGNIVFSADPDALELRFYLDPTP